MIAKVLCLYLNIIFKLFNYKNRKESMDLSNYSFYLKPPQTSDDLLFRILVNIISCVLLLSLYYMSINCSDTSWAVREEVETSEFDIDDFHTGDMLLVFKQGHDFILFPGHMAIVVELPRYGQKYVWDLPVPIKYEPNVLKPLSRYMKGALSGRGSKVYVHHLLKKAGGYLEARDILPMIKRMSASIHYKLQTAHDHANFCVHSILGLPGIPDIFPDMNEKDLHYCSSAILELLIHAGVIDKSIMELLPTYCRELNIWQGTMGTTVYPQMFIHPSWDLEKYVNPEWVYTPLKVLKRG
jgi:hypothetical protein